MPFWYTDVHRAISSEIIGRRKYQVLISGVFVYGNLSTWNSITLYFQANDIGVGIGDSVVVKRVGVMVKKDSYGKRKNICN